MPLVEVVKGEKTAMETVNSLSGLLARAGKKPVTVLKDTPGQLGNRLFQALLREAIHIVEEGIASVEDVDTAVKNGLGRRFPVYGPLEHNDVVGLDTLYAIQSYIGESLCRDQKPAELLKNKFDNGDLGVKTGKGFYDWQVRDGEELTNKRDRFLLDLLKMEQLGGQDT
jgi:3-hydroxybutyryl-CoA dehydrogenase